MVGGVLNIALSLADIVIRRLRGRKVRQPSRDQVDDIAEPLASLAIRHLDMTKFGPDLADIVAAGGAASGYMREGPMTEPLEEQPPVVQVGMEHGVEEVPTTQLMPTPDYEAAYGSTPVVTYLS